VTITLKGDPLPDGEYAFDVAKPVGAVSVPFDVTFQVTPTVDMASSGQASWRFDTFKQAGYYGDVMNTSQVIYVEWDKVVHMERRLRVWGTVQFPIEPSCKTYVTYNVQIRHDGYQTDYRPLIGFSGVQGDWGERYASRITCRRNPPADTVDSLHFEEFQQCDWGLEPEPLDECIDVGGVPAPPLMPVLNMSSRWIVTGGSFVWPECPVDDLKSVVVPINENWGNGSSHVGIQLGIPAYRGIGIFVQTTDYLGTCVVRQPYESDNSFNLTIEAEFYD
jgi:hypothetical protein